MTSQKWAAVLFFCASLHGLAAAQTPAKDFLEQARHAKSESEWNELAETAPDSLVDDPDIAEALLPDHAYGDWQEWRDDVVAMVASRIALSEPVKGGKLADPGGTAREILSHPAYRDSGGRSQTDVAKKARTSLSDWLDGMRRESMLPAAAGAGAIGGAAALAPVVWGLLIVGLVVALGFLLVRFQIVRRRRVRAALLDDEEQALTSDEWLERAKGLEDAGQFREAVRCLYVASLIRLDEHRLLKFVRAETNWEHLRRFEASQDRPNVDLLGATRVFDRAWYGFRGSYPEDLTLLRNVYTSILEAVA